MNRYRLFQKEYMMKTKTNIAISILAISSLLAAGNVFAKHPKSDRNGHQGPPGVEEQLARISRSLELSDAQSVEMLVILQQADMNRTALHEQSMEIMGAEICAQKAQTEEEILSILDAEQAESFMQLKAEREERAQGRSHSRKGRGGPDCSQYTDAG